jgi:hypothetical protein
MGMDMDTDMDTDTDKDMDRDTDTDTNHIKFFITFSSLPVVKNIYLPAVAYC